MKQVAHPKPITIKNNRSNDVVRGVVVDEESIDDKKYWVIMPDNRPGSKLRFAKDAWSIVKGK
jgi:hypothetical protein